MNEFEPHDSYEIFDVYGHPLKYSGQQGCYIMFNKNGECSWCPSGNELRRLYLLNPSNWVTGPIWVPMSEEDHDRVFSNFSDLCDKW